MSNNTQLKAQYKNQYSKIGEFDSIASEIIQVFIVRLIVTMRLKFNSRDKAMRKECFIAAKLLAAISSSYLDSKKIHYK